MSYRKDTFAKYFCNDDDCYKHLASIKWQDDAFICKKCGNTTYHKGRSPYSRRCNRCKYDESVTAGTMFEKLKFPILAAFGIIYRMVKTNVGNTSVELANAFHIQQRSCWAFMHKVREAMCDMKPKQLNGDVGVGFFGLIEKNSPEYYRRVYRGIWSIPRQRILMAVEVKDRKMKKVVAEVVEDENVELAISFINRHVNTDAHIIFVTRKKGFNRKMKQTYKSVDLPYGWRPVEYYFENLKDWLYKGPHMFTFKYLQLYTNEYNFHRNYPRSDIRSFYALVRVMANKKKDHQV